MAEFQYEVTEQIGVLAEGTKSWKKELNLVSWGGRPAKYDIRDWSEDHTKMGKGVTLTVEELKGLKAILNKLEI